MRFNRGLDHLAYCADTDATDLFRQLNEKEFCKDLRSAAKSGRQDHPPFRSNHADSKARARGLALTSVMAESAKKLEHFDFVREHGCDIIQGYFYPRAVLAHEMEKLLQQSSPMLD